MAEMTAGQRAAAAAGLMDDLSRTREALGALTKAEFRAAVDAADTWANNNSASYNSALPLPARTVLTAPQKARLLAAVVLARWTNGA